ncbi:Uncharacterized protein TCM_007051 [Theobroma cacao]|uniref:Uncharacterized protein n=1 Tax=Theobroma cacao TaxID=3641 RepID=A0A061DZQ1_THECC|nr:Uncharacterized protein TCM_007051 [Theobroma cacao]
MAPAIGNFDVQDRRDKQKSASGTSIKMATPASDGTSHAWRQEGAGINFKNHLMEPPTQAATRLHGDEQTRPTMRELPLASAVGGPDARLEVHVQGKKGADGIVGPSTATARPFTAQHGQQDPTNDDRRGKEMNFKMSTVVDGIMAQDSMQAGIGGKEAKIGAARNKKKKK